MQDTECRALSTVGFVPLDKGYTAIVDAVNLPILSKFRWWSFTCGGNVYASVRNVGYMHRLLTSPPRHLLVDHVNHNGLDNRLCNLRFATYAQNCRNRRKPTVTRQTSQYKGVSRRSNGFEASIGHNGETVRIGVFDDELQAAKAYDAVASQLHGEFASLNFPKAIPSQGPYRPPPEFSQVLLAEAIQRQIDRESEQRESKKRQLEAKAIAKQEARMEAQRQRQVARDERIKQQLDRDERREYRLRRKELKAQWREHLRENRERAQERAEAIKRVAEFKIWFRKWKKHKPKKLPRTPRPKRATKPKEMRKLRYQWLAVEIGESFVVECKRSASEVARYGSRRHHPRQFDAYETRGFIVITRIADATGPYRTGMQRIGDALQRAAELHQSTYTGGQHNLFSAT